MHLYEYTSHHKDFERQNCRVMYVRAWVWRSVLFKDREAHVGVQPMHVGFLEAFKKYHADVPLHCIANLDSAFI